jgi:calcium binding protein 39
MAGILGSIFKTKKSPEGTVGKLKKDLLDLRTAVTASSAAAGGVGAAEERLNVDIAKRVDEVKEMLFGEGDGATGGGGAGGAAPGGPDPSVVEALTRALMAEEVIPAAVSLMRFIDFETRRSFVAIFLHLLRADIAGFTSAYLPRHTPMLEGLVDGYRVADVALHCGTLLRECLKVPRLHECMLYEPVSDGGGGGGGGGGRGEGGGLWRSPQLAGVVLVSLV